MKLGLNSLAAIDLDMLHGDTEDQDREHAALNRQFQGKRTRKTTRKHCHARQTKRRGYAATR